MRTSPAGKFNVVASGNLDREVEVSSRDEIAGEYESTCERLAAERSGARDD